MKQLKLICALFIAMVLTSCGSSGMEGTYTGAAAMGFAEVTLTFQPNGKAIGEMMGTERELTYELEGNKIKIKVQEGVSEIWTLQEDGSITRGGVILVKKE